MKEIFEPVNKTDKDTSEELHKQSKVFVKAIRKNFTSRLALTNPKKREKTCSNLSKITFETHTKVDQKLRVHKSPKEAS